MKPVHVLTLRSFILALHELPAVPQALQTSLQSLPANEEAMLENIYKLIEQEPLAAYYKKLRGLLKAREGVRSKGDRPNISSDPSPNTEQDNIAVAYDEPTAKFETILEAIENQTLAGLKAIVERITYNPQQDPRQAIESGLGFVANE
ncbi:MAG: hypothetical protein HC916_20675 [Coleofasciculaceae cyanobacterium SM2_1_6]|nr:hypothetical protein [Coleofasciculaceae cyanobacterium SM2_1_6]